MGKEQSNTKRTASRSIGSLSGIVAVRTLGRTLGLIKTLLLARYFGASTLTDSYYLALQIATTIGLFLGIGPIRTTATTILIQADVKRGSSYSSRILFIYIIDFLIIGFCIISILMLTTKQWLAFVFPGLSSIGPLSILTYLLLPTYLIMGIYYIAASGLYMRNKFVPLEIANLLVSMTLITIIVALHKKLSIYSAGVGFLIGTSLGLIFIISVLARLKMLKPTSPNFKIHWVKALFLQGGATLVFTFWEQAFRIFERSLGSIMRIGVITSLTQAQQLVGAVMYLLAQPISLIVHPTLARSYALNDLKTFELHFLRALRLAIYTYLPISFVFSVVISRITHLFLQQGEFTVSAANVTGLAAQVLAFGIAFQGLYMLLMRTMLALKGSKGLARIGFYGWTFAMILDVFMASKFQIAGLAATTVIAFAVLDVVMLLSIRNMTKISFSPIFPVIAKSLFASTIMYFLINLIVRNLPLTAPHGLWLRILMLGQICAYMLIGIGLYVIITKIIGLKEPEELLTAIKLFLKSKIG